MPGKLMFVPKVVLRLLVIGHDVNTCLSSWTNWPQVQNRLSRSVPLHLPVSTFSLCDERRIRVNAIRMKSGVYEPSCDAVYTSWGDSSGLITRYVLNLDPSEVLIL